MEKVEPITFTWTASAHLVAEVMSAFLSRDEDKMLQYCTHKKMQSVETEPVECFILFA